MADVTEAKPLFNSNDGVTGRDGGPYLDIVQAQESEKVRAVIEGREPDLENPPANAGIQLNPAGRQVQTENVNNLPSQSGNTGIGVTADASMKAHVDSDKNPLKPVGELPKELFDPADPDAEVVDPSTQDYIAGSTEGNAPVGGSDSESNSKQTAADKKTAEDSATAEKTDKKDSSSAFSSSTAKK